MGDIEDESDKKEKDLIKLKGKRIIVNGTASIEDVNEVLNLNIEHEEYQTIAGYVLDKLDHIPDVNERLILNDYRVRIMKVEDRRIIEMEFTPINSIRISDVNNINNTEVSTDKDDE